MTAACPSRRGSPRPASFPGGIQAQGMAVLGAALLPLLLLLLLLGDTDTAQAVSLQKPLWDSKIAHHKANLVTQARKPCTSYKKTKRIIVRRPADVWKRLRFNNKTTVTLLFQRDMSLTYGFLLNGSFSCTIFRAANSKQRVTLFYKGWDAPIIKVQDALNMLFIGIGLQNAVTNKAPNCWLELGGESRSTCPALYIIRSAGIQYTKAKVYGRIDIFRSAYVKLDSLSVTMARLSYWPGQDKDTFDVKGIVRIGECGAGPLMRKSGIVVSNNHIFGGWELLTLYRGAVGVTVRNNHFDKYDWTAVRCGADVGYVMDCHLNNIDYNYIYTKPGVVLTGDSAGIYTCTHWFNPKNSMTCNYVFGGDHCYYYDFASSGIEMWGGVCAYAYSGFKVNTGKMNKATDVIMYKILREVYVISCITSTMVTCNWYPGNYYDKIRKEFYDIPSINNAYPWFREICNPLRTSINGVQCNPAGPSNTNGAATGQCSGLPYGNQISVISVGHSNNNKPLDFCQSLPAAFALNKDSYTNITLQQAAFSGKGDFSIKKSSAIWKFDPTFINCPRRLVGPKFVKIQSYYNEYNMQGPGVLNDIIKNNFSNIFQVQPNTFSTKGLW